ncbi:MAG TPA: alpha-glucosidase, partial [Thermoanaerobaculia bacterium]|nr:alpha-glucosidase [Thermoanaerobaculia bacterium]
MRKIALFTFVFVALPLFAEQAWNPVADPKAIVVEGRARFTVLTPRLIRMEWGQFEDHASLVFVNRRLPVPQFTTSHDGDALVIRTAALTLRYRPEAKFSSDDLRVDFDLNGKPVTWTPGTPDKGNLGGTTRTLDGARGAVPLEPGLISRDGWVVVDDSNRPLFDNSDWPWVMERPLGDRQDLYLF